MKYPIKCYGIKFTKGDDFHEWISDLYKKPRLTEKEMLIILYTYDNGYLAHPDYKYLKNKSIKHEK
jgi:hypothetical protein